VSNIPNKVAVSENLLSRRERYKRAAALLDQWERASGDYDERVWPILDEELKDSVLRCSEDESTT
jgi:hypothetical protein